MVFLLVYAIGARSGTPKTVAGQHCTTGVQNGVHQGAEPWCTAGQRKLVRIDQCLSVANSVRRVYGWTVLVGVCRCGLVYGGVPGPRS